MNNKQRAVARAFMRENADLGVTVGHADGVDTLTLFRNEDVFARSSTRKFPDQMSEASVRAAMAELAAEARKAD